jgi:uncharacterized OB-fold protein
MADKGSAGAAAYAHYAMIDDFRLQKCHECGAVSWPPRDVCAFCWSAKLKWRPVSSTGLVIVETALHSSNEPFFRSRLPWRIGIVKLEAGPVAYAHLSAGVREGDQTRLISRVDWRGRGVLIALPARGGGVGDDPKLNDLIGNQNN